MNMQVVLHLMLAGDVHAQHNRRSVMLCSVCVLTSEARQTADMLCSSAELHSCAGGSQTRQSHQHPAAVH